MEKKNEKITFFFVFNNDNNIVLILKDISVIVTINALYIVFLKR